MKNIANKLYSYLHRKKLILRDNCPFDEAYNKIKKLKKFENLSESNVKEGYQLLKDMIKEKPLDVNSNNNNSDLNEKSEDKSIYINKNKDDKIKKDSE